MLFLNVWQLSNNITPSKLAKAAAKVLEEEKFPVEGVETIQWLVCPGGFGITIVKADSEAAAFKMYTIWAEALPGFFESYKLMPALDVQEAIPMSLE